MSHFTTIKTEVRDLDALREACLLWEREHLQPAPIGVAIT